MDSTPRLRSAFPSTPQSRDGARQNGAVSTPLKPFPTKLPPAPSKSQKKAGSSPLIPVNTLDAASQRLIVFSFYTILWIWRFSDFYRLVSDDTESLWLFMKWVAIDGTFLFGLPTLRVPWLEWSSTMMTVLFVLHAVLDAMLMFKIGFPITFWFAAAARALFDTEMAIDEKPVKASHFDSASLILGKQVIHILPEGSALLNPNRESFCLGGPKYSIELPIQINQTNPVLIELERIDFETAENETIIIKSSEIKKLRSKALGGKKALDPSSPVLLRYPVKKTGRYVFQKIIDESKLEVRPRPSEVMVVTCPQARVLPASANKCRGELSDISLEVYGTPPLQVKYRKMVNDNPVAASFQSIQPEDFVSPFTKKQSPLLTKSGEADFSWARAQKVVVPVSEQLFSSGRWSYAIEEVTDVLGNVVSYATHLDDLEKPKAKLPEVLQVFTVHERPRIYFSNKFAQGGCDQQHPLKVQKGDWKSLPILFDSNGKGTIQDTPHTVEYLFTPEASVLQNGEHNPEAQKLLKHDFKNNFDRLHVSESGLYSLKSVSTKFCSGEVVEPATCMLENPPEPEVAITATNITDKCAGNPVGLTLDMDFVGTPPFTLKYMVQKMGWKDPVWKTVEVSGLRGQVTLTPEEAGHYVYTFAVISDKYYDRLSIFERIEQTVKPTASAKIDPAGLPKSLCIHERAIFKVKFFGEGPWTLGYELVHSGSRKRQKIENIVDDLYTIRTDPLESGGEYTIALTSVKAAGCEVVLKEGFTFSVRHQRPKGGFAEIDGKRVISTLENKRVEIPMRLTGEAPWRIDYRNTDDPDRGPLSYIASSANAVLPVPDRGTYQLINVRDVHCPGFVDENANRFTVNWIKRPELVLSETPTLELAHGKFTKKEVCEGDEDYLELAFNGSPPFELKYEEHAKPDQGSKSLRKKQVSAALGVASIQLETTKAGTYEYRFSEVSDSNYDSDPKRSKAVVVQQRVNPRPSARFSNPGKIYSFCTVEESADEIVPVTFTGVPPFYLEVELKHAGTPKPDVLNFPNIPNNAHSLRIPHRYLHQGHSHLSIRKVRDSRGCQNKLDPAITPRVQISVHDAPTIAPMDSKLDFCVGERLSFRLTGAPAFSVFYTFRGADRKATSAGNTFRRMAESPGVFTITGVSDAASDCKASVEITKNIHPLPSVRISKGRETVVDIHEGGEAEILFEFTGTPPFEFTYTRSENAKRGRKAAVLETRTERTSEFSHSVKASEEGTYEVTSVRDKWCTVSKTGSDETNRKGQKLLLG
ncbi:hypothetical protein EJ06DRAFT_549357 [Trichodelitschia bisporula]|uniref:Nucleoporin Pom152 n=1 Tax=Trichodelitschia bisporula TaxID=703511 RepID=A0A6G1HV64_9PEZI|nr:hypothetical protein EJ06DRAFT_549357 [Trichodelitschia bisporula]